MKDLNYGKEYKYAHSFDGNFVKDNFMPDQLKGQIFYTPGSNSKERENSERLAKLWDGVYSYNKSKDDKKENTK
jgi:putative ATPase